MQAIPAWVGRYVGLPFLPNGRDHRGVDCWGLVRLVLLEQFAIDLPFYHFGYETCRERKAIGGVVQEVKEAPGWAKVEKPTLSSVVVFKVMGYPCHVGLMVTEEMFLHSAAGHDSCVESLRSLRWKNRVEGYYQFVAG